MKNIKSIFLKLKSKLKVIIENFYKLSFLEKPLPNNPFGNKILASKDTYSRLHFEAISTNDELVCKFEKKYGFSLDLKWWRELALHTQVVIKPEKLNFFHGRLLYSVLSKYIDDIETSKKHINIFETGTARGFSSICMSKALIEMNCSGVITTVDSIPHNKKIFWNCIDDHQGPKSRANLLKPWAEELERIVFIQGWTKNIINRLGLQRINFAFLDAQHTKDDVLSEFCYVKDRQLSGDIIVFDDVTEGLFEGVCDAIKIVERNYPYSIERINFSDNRGYAIAIRD